MIMLSCKEASRLVSAGLDGDLNLTQRSTLRLHLMLCTACARVKSQFAFLHRAAAQYPGPDDENSSQKSRGD
ncbi:MAG: zf-HC2 domain-containing protein [Betaproteobacteria bacterium]|nr:zf-HC2 domain-containing protein [Betaproteobacteria bacterium]